jgi:hypothetical protein
MAGEEVVNSDGDLISVTRGDLLNLWLLAHDGLESITASGSGAVLITPYLEEVAELLYRTSEKLGNPCIECRLSNGVHKMDCSNG